MNGLALDSNRSVIVKLGGAVSANEIDVVAVYADYTSSSFTPGQSEVHSNGTSEVTAISAPASGTTRLVSGIKIVNRDTANVRVILEVAVGANRYRFYDRELRPDRDDGGL